MADGTIILDECHTRKGQMAGGAVSFVGCGQLQLMRVQLYKTVWEEHTSSHNQQATQAAVVTNVQGSNELCFGLGGATISELEELCTVLTDNATVVYCITTESATATASTLRVLQAVARCGGSVWLICEAEVDVYSDAGAWILSLLANAEMPRVVRCLKLDIPTGALAAATAMVHSRELHLVTQHGAHQVPRLLAAHSSILGPVELVVHSRGALSSLSVSAQRINPSATLQAYATLQVKAAGLNFRDVLNVLGMYPGMPG